jgi:hypothetical protein
MLYLIKECVVHYGFSLNDVIIIQRIVSFIYDSAKHPLCHQGLAVMLFDILLLPYPLALEMSMRE